MTEPTKLYDDLMGIPARVGLIFHLRTMVVDGACPMELEDLLEGMDVKDVRSIWPDMTADDVAALLGGDVDLIEEVVDRLSLNGFLVRVETPIVKKNSYSWGCYTHKLIYADTFDDALRAGIAWATAKHEEGMTP